VPRKRSIAGRYRISETGIGVPLIEVTRVCRYGFMNHGRDSRYVISRLDGDVLSSRTWTPPRSWPWPVSHRDTVSGGGEEIGITLSANATRQLNG